MSKNRYRRKYTAGFVPFSGTVVTDNSVCSVKIRKLNQNSYLLSPMSQPTIRVVAHLIALPEKVEELKSLLLSIIEPSRQEEGCIKYELLQNNNDPTDFTFVEEWESDSKLDAHLASANIQEALPKLESVAAVPPDIRRYQLLM